MKSNKKACLESGNLTQIYLIETKSGWPILTQANLVCDCQEVRCSLTKIKQLLQFLEILDKVLVEEELDDMVWKKVIKIRTMILACDCSSGQIKHQLYDLISLLGFEIDEENSEQEVKQPSRSVLDYVAELTNQKMRSFSYLSQD